MLRHVSVRAVERKHELLCCYLPSEQTAMSIMIFVLYFPTLVEQIYVRGHARWSLNIRSCNPFNRLWDRGTLIYACALHTSVINVEVCVLYRGENRCCEVRWSQVPQLVSDRNIVQIQNLLHYWITCFPSANAYWATSKWQVDLQERKHEYL